MAPPELNIIGLTCNLVGVFFLANSIIFRKLKNVISVFFGVKLRSLNTIKDYTLNNLQVALGFIFLTLGFLLQVYAELTGALEATGSGMWLVCAGIVVGAVVIFVVGASYSRHTFKKYLRRFFHAHPEAFNRDMAITKEIGEFLGIPHSQEETVEEYLLKVRAGLRMPADDLPPTTGAGLGTRGRGHKALQGRHS